MDNRKQQIDNFFIKYAERVNNALKKESSDVDGTIKSFSDCFIAANPSGVSCGKNDEHFQTAVSQGYTFYKNIGITSMDILAKEITILDNYHTMIKIHWKCSYTKKENLKGNIEFDVIYFLQIRENEHKIFAYITGDEQKALKEIGLI